MDHIRPTVLLFASFCMLQFAGCNREEEESSIGNQAETVPAAEAETPKVEVQDVVALPEPLTWDTILEKHELLPSAITGESLNSAGFALYEKGLFEDASIVFREATRLDENYRYSFYNLASTLGVLHGNNEAVDLGELFRALDRSIMIAPIERLAKVAGDADFDSLRDLAEYHRIIAKHQLSGSYDSNISYQYSFYPDGRFIYFLMFEMGALGEGSWYLQPDGSDPDRGLVELSGRYASESAVDGSIRSRRYPFATYDLADKTISLFSDSARKDQMRVLRFNGNFVNPVGQYEIPDVPIDEYENHYLYQKVIDLRR